MKVGFIGGGNMGGALIGGLTQKCCAPSDIALYEKDAQKAAAFKEMGINTVESASAAEAASEIIVFSVKPNIIDSVLSEMSGDKNKIYLSIA
ncbi:MAG: NAD(P)-binding domain-containing protein, partial [Clostridiales bacterium]|nr:NAD(P)-binding domain-containing protein [Clostridiales bacterium]